MLCCLLHKDMDMVQSTIQRYQIAHKQKSWGCNHSVKLITQCVTTMRCKIIMLSLVAKEHKILVVFMQPVLVVCFYRSLLSNFNVRWPQGPETCPLRGQVYICILLDLRSKVWFSRDKRIGIRPPCGSVKNNAQQSGRGYTRCKALQSIYKA
jgi:hypothetical protein